MNNATRNWKTTLAGLMTLAFAGLGIWQDPTLATSPATASAVLGGVGLIFAKDSDKSGTSAVPK